MDRLDAKACDTCEHLGKHEYLDCYSMCLAPLVYPVNVMLGKPCGELVSRLIPTQRIEDQPELLRPCPLYHPRSSQSAWT